MHFWVMIVVSVATVFSATAEEKRKSPAGTEPSKSPMVLALQSTAESLNLTPVQKEIFAAEVLTHPQWFVRDQLADVDRLLLRNYLSFIDNGTTVLSLIVDPKCVDCAKNKKQWRQLLSDLWARRGSKVEWGTSTTLNSLVDFARKKGADGAVLFEIKEQWGNSDDEGGSNAHSDERSFVLKLNVRNRIGAGKNASDLEKVDQTLTVMENDSLTEAMRKLVGVGFSEMGAHRTSAPSRGVAGTIETDLVVRKVSDFARYSEIRNKIRSALESVALVEERSFGFHEAGFSVLAHQGVGISTADALRIEVKKRVNAIRLEDNPLPLEWEMRE